ncbi:MAG: HEAT repeat domain-containing protein [Deltaproteobacteria bacterium]|nr:HEAT repeat domain-containing protein [Deltaproteobacteria bacterium]
MAQELSDHTNILIELCKAVKMHNFYPGGHPNLDTSVERCFNLLKKNLDELAEIKWRVEPKGFFLDKAPLAAGNHDAEALAKKVFFRRIKEITFTQRVAVKDLKQFLSLLRLEPEEVQKKGGAEGILAVENVSGILLNAVRYEDLEKLKKQIEEAREKEALAQPEDMEPAAAPGEAAAEEEQQPEEKIKEEDEPLSTLLEKIKNEKDLLKYKDLSIRIKERLDVLLNEKKHDEAVPSLRLFNLHTELAPGFAMEISAVALENLTSCLNADMIRYLVNRVGRKDEPLRNELQQIIVRGGAEAVEILLDAVIEAPEAYARRHHFNTLVHYGPAIRTNVENRLTGEWYVIRQMVSLLGELGDPESLPALEKEYHHPDARVKKEVLKGIVKIPGPRTNAILLHALGETDEMLVKQAILSAGHLKEASAIDSLGKIALKRDPFSETADTVKEAIKALGTIGSDKAVPILTNILFRKVWLGKKSNEEIRTLAAVSLGMIGTKEANEAIKKTSSDSSGELYTACKRILDSIKKETDKRA